MAPDCSVSADTLGLVCTPAQTGALRPTFLASVPLPSGLDSHLQHPIALVREQLVSGHDVVELELVRHQHTQVNAARGHDVHQAAHALLAAGAQGGDDAVVAQAGGEGVQRDGKVAGIHAQAGQGAAGFEHTQGRFEGLLGAQRLNGRIHTAPAGDGHDLVNHVALVEVEREVGAQLFGNVQPVIVAVHRNDGGRAHQARPRRGAQANGALCKHHHGVADADACVLGTFEAGGHDVGAHQHLLVGQAVGHGGQVALRIGHQHVFSLRAANQVAKTPARRGLVAVAAAQTLGNQSCDAAPSCAAYELKLGQMAPAITRWPSV